MDHEVQSITSKISISSRASSSTVGTSDNNYHQREQANAKAGELTRSQLESRWLILAMSCMVLFGSYYSYDNPSALHTQLKNHMHEFEDYEIYFNRLYSVCSFPNIFLPFFGGAFVDKIGAPICAVGFSILLLLGQIMFALGVNFRSWALMLIGRTVYGLGQENIAIAQSVILADWFVGSRALSLAFGVSLSISRLGSVLNNFITPVVANDVDTASAAWIGVMANALSVCLSVVVALLDRSAEDACNEKNLFAKNRIDKMLSEFDEDNAQIVNKNGKDEWNDPDRLPELSFEAARHLQRIIDRNSVQYNDIFRLGQLFWYLCFSCSVVYGCILPFNNVAQGILLERDYFRIPSSECVLKYPTECSTGSLANPNGNPPIDLYESDGIVCVGDNIAPVLPSSIEYVDLEDESYDYSNYKFDPLDIYDVNCNDNFWRSGCSRDFCEAQFQATEKASRIMSIPYIVSAIMSPFLGHVVDQIGYRSILITLSPVLLVIVHTILGFSSMSPIFPLILQGIAFSIFAAVIWPSVPLCVEQRYVGIAFGLMSAFQNVGLTLFPIFVADLHQTGADRYIPDVEILFIILALKAVFSGGFLIWKDTKLESVLTKGQCYILRPGKDQMTLIETFPTTRSFPVTEVDDDAVLADSKGEEEEEENFVTIDVRENETGDII
mmetsp:Transcript_2453/g.3398  ORF Transcript_2453/g.3398 Transcript_2453/m.3398 type:complete len:667 (-) Transcript_2453:2357-4357(-)|eukprot:CAMPEP_0116059796 /NCGR_PEP_ID=MMETSP0322-20121206/6017_1 /TAXON_ID=163516 /ORGANISM="Leptocylindrus danicus var. apora, Strain B651" /LENGTH=666 /DNA_ID=CAMNT_0003544261 /DNA_START=206 /DNA_END=2206 /DNA_ORIENTATION=-